jgi:hypothetical protein
VELADAIEALRAGLYEAMQRGWQANMRFRPSPVEVTLQAQLTRNAEGKLGWGVVAIGGKAEAVTVQTLKLTLTPEWRDGDRLGLPPVGQRMRGDLGRVFQR